MLIGKSLSVCILRIQYPVHTGITIKHLLFIHHVYFLDRYLLTTGSLRRLMPHQGEQSNRLCYTVHNLIKIDNCVKYTSITLTLSILTLHCHLHPLQAVNCCRNSRLVVDEDDLKWVKN